MQTKGFTMIEMLFVISIYMILCLLTFQNHNVVDENKECILVQNTFQLARSHAITTHEKTNVQVSKDYISISSDSLNRHISLQSVYFMNSHSFSYNKIGHIKIAKTLKLHTKKGIKKFVFQLGSGTFYVS